MEASVDGQESQHAESEAPNQTGSQPKAKSSARVKSSLADFSTSELQAELARRREDLIKQRDELEIQIDETGRLLGGFQPTRSKTAASQKTSPRLKKRSKRTRSARAATGGRITLVDTLADILKGKEMGIPEIQSAVERSGYKSKAANFRTLLTITLSQNDRFARVSRGVYTLKK